MKGVFAALGIVLWSSIASAAERYEGWENRWDGAGAGGPPASAPVAEEEPRLGGRPRYDSSRDPLLQLAFGLQGSVVAQGESNREGSQYGYGEMAPSFLASVRYFPALHRNFLVGPVFSTQYYVGDFDLDRGGAGRFLVRPGGALLLDFTAVYVQVPVTLDLQFVPPLGEAVHMTSEIGTGVGTGLDFGVFLPRRRGVFASVELNLRYDWISQRHTFESATSGDTFSERATYELLWFGISGVLNWRDL